MRLRRSTISKYVSGARLPSPLLPPLKLVWLPPVLIWLLVASCRSFGIIHPVRSTLKFGLTEICLLRENYVATYIPFASEFHLLAGKLCMFIVHPQWRGNFHEPKQLLERLKRAK